MDRDNRYYSARYLCYSDKSSSEVEEADQEGMKVDKKGDRFSVDAEEVEGVARAGEVGVVRPGKQKMKMGEEEGDRIHLLECEDMMGSGSCCIYRLMI